MTWIDEDTLNKDGSCVVQENLMTIGKNGVIVRAFRVYVSESHLREMRRVCVGMGVV